MPAHRPLSARVPATDLAAPVAGAPGFTPPLPSSRRRMMSATV